MQGFSNYQVNGIPGQSGTYGMYAKTMKPVMKGFLSNTTEILHSIHVFGTAGLSHCKKLKLKSFYKLCKIAGRKQVTLDFKCQYLFSNYFFLIMYINVLICCRTL